MSARGLIPYRAVFEFFPTGIVVTAASGAVLGSNLRAKTLLGGLVEQDGVRCCDLLGCRRAGTPLASHCISELALGHEGPLPELRVDLPESDGAPAGSVWVTGSPYGGTEPCVVLHLRPGIAGDRRRRTEPHWIGAAQLRVFTLGRTRIETGEGPLTGEWLGHKPGAVLKYLIVHRDRVVPTDELIEALWPQSGRRGVTSVRQAVHALRDRLEPARLKRRGSSFVSARSGGYELERAAFWIDADDFEAAARAGLRALAEEDAETAEAALTRAVAVYRGEFLAEESYAEWAYGERARLRELAGQSLRALAELREAAGEQEEATELRLRHAEMEPYDLDAHRALMALLIRRGRHPEAARRDEAMRRRYRSTFGEDPPAAASA